MGAAGASRMSQSDPLNMLRELRATIAVGPRSPECLDDHVVAALADGTLDAGSRASALPHLATCAHCRGAVARVARALTDRSVARAMAATEQTGIRWLRVAVPVAAAAIVLVLVMPRHPREGLQHRAPTITAATSPTPIEPIGEESAVRALRWASVEGVDRYRATLYAADGRVLYETEVADTVVVLPDSVNVATGRYLWTVAGRTGWNRWTASRLVQFQVVHSPVQ